MPGSPRPLTGVDSCWALSPRSAFIASGPVLLIPIELAKVRPCFSAVRAASPRIGMPLLRPKPDSEIALVNRPLACGEVIRKFTRMPPALSPKMVTFPASPPNWPMLAFTHFSAAMLSISP
jgi:hypothetical protein